MVVGLINREYSISISKNAWNKTKIANSQLHKTLSVDVQNIAYPNGAWEEMSRVVLGIYYSTLLIIN